VKENAMTSTGTTRISEVRTVAVPVTDQDRALAFYTGPLGFGVRLDGAFGGRRWLEVAPEGATTSLALVPPGERATTGVDTGIRLTTGDAAGDHALLRAAGVDVDPEVLRYPGVPPMFGFRDPDGNRLYVVERA
jgi:catechol 2,3-dioxygenase-like lactoylglutathione lyase family enzyme